jgi:hypothetical protein
MELRGLEPLPPYCQADLTAFDEVRRSSKRLGSRGSPLRRTPTNGNEPRSKRANCNRGRPVAKTAHELRSEVAGLSASEIAGCWRRARLAAPIAYGPRTGKSCNRLTASAMTSVEESNAYDISNTSATHTTAVSAERSHDALTVARRDDLVEALDVGEQHELPCLALPLIIGSCSIETTTAAIGRLIRCSAESQLV